MSSSYQRASGKFTYSQLVARLRFVSVRRSGPHDGHGSDSRKKILEALAKSSGPIGPGEIAALTSLERNNVDQLLHQMKAANEVIQPSRGLYVHPDNYEPLSKTVTTPKKPK